MFQKSNIPKEYESYVENEYESILELTIEPTRVIKRQDLDPYFEWVEACSVGTTKIQSLLLRAKDRATERLYRPGALGYQAARRQWGAASSTALTEMNVKKHSEHD